LGEGDKVEARYRGRGKYYRGKISRVNSDDTFDINYDDGEKDIGLSQEHIRPLESQGSVRSPGRNGKMREGDKVEARYRGRGKYYRGKIARVNSDGTFDINYDDGEKDRGLAEEHIKPLEAAGGGVSDRRRGGALLEGDKVEVNCRGKGKYYKGRIARVNLDGTFNIDYDDGEKERGVSEDMIKVLNGDSGNDLGGSGRDSERDGKGGEQLLEGDKVEARYRGRGKYYRGKIARVNSDGTFDIDYDDGEKERGLSHEHIKPSKKGTNRHSDYTMPSTIVEGDKVE
ncbi:unnamed protein product, partial [Choristocarpus tenellus]